MKKSLFNNLPHAPCHASGFPRSRSCSRASSLLDRFWHPNSHKRIAGQSPMPKFTTGFTLIETFVAITIIMIVIVGPLTLAQRSLNSASLTKEKMTASFLAQDAIEYVRSVRDGKILSESGWASFITYVNPCKDKYCTINTFTGTPPAICPPSGLFDDCPNLKYDAGNYLYRYDTGGQSPYKRGIKIAETNGNEVMVEVKIVWTSQGFGSQTVVLKDALLDW